MKQSTYYFRQFASMITLLVLVLCISACKKDNLKSKYASLLQHKWNFRSTSKRDLVLGSYASPWQTTQYASGNAFKEFTSDGQYNLYTNGAIFFTQKYQLTSDSVIL